MKKEISQSWIKHLKTDEEKNKFKEFIRSSTPVLNVLKELIEQKIEANSIFQKEDYSKASWAYESADRNGYVRALVEITKLLDI